MGMQPEIPTASFQPWSYGTPPCVKFRPKREAAPVSVVGRKLQANRKPRRQFSGMRVQFVEVDRMKVRLDHPDAQADRSGIDWLPKEIREQNRAAAALRREADKCVAASRKT